MAGLTSSQVLAAVTGDHGCSRAPQAVVSDAELIVPERQIALFDTMTLD